jgi:hypothetical protein
MNRPSLSATSILFLLLAGTILCVRLASVAGPSAESALAGFHLSAAESGLARTFSARIQNTIESPLHAAEDWDCPKSHGTLGHLPIWTCSHGRSVTLESSSLSHALPETWASPLAGPAPPGFCGLSGHSSDICFPPYRPPARLL